MSKDMFLPDLLVEVEMKGTVYLSYLVPATARAAVEALGGVKPSLKSHLGGWENSVQCDWVQFGQKKDLREHRVRSTYTIAGAYRKRACRSLG